MPTTTKQRPIHSCPWCKDGDNVFVRETPTSFYVLCDACAASGPTMSKEGEAINQWNKVAEFCERETTWTPITSAPKNGTKIIVFYEFAGVPITHVAWWSSDEHDQWEIQRFESKEQAIGWWAYIDNSVSQTKLEGPNTPTHWMPLPGFSEAL